MKLHFERYFSHHQAETYLSKRSLIKRACSWRDEHISLWCDIVGSAKFRRSRAAVGLVGLVPSCLCGYFVGPKVFLARISWAQNIFSWVFRAFQIFSRGYFVGPKFFLLYISWVQDFFLWVFCDSKVFSLG